tara:strand:+ start:98 stop:238 length:141 start_codon:yes stop_codon:yes gene_type:complete
MKYIVLTVLSLFVVTGCASSNISVSANIPESQEIDIRITTEKKNSN